MILRAFKLLMSENRTLTVSETEDHKHVRITMPNCGPVALTKEEAKELANLIEDKYRGSYETNYIRYADDYDFRKPIEAEEVDESI